ncbi:polysaccharide deacetylase family protein [Paraburkholderia sp. NMBU_R16]|uniref:polysaccharide deacetylase family protein n=1 Tax=Paraburkholderia sp. NMBU_R16 TaxID=2698676 RepID=UPI001567554B|nr:polysaccharide deacetylase family protein [Paraburkholderia sp. NMBU_R16]NRO96969.1 polysaccharide deacetylase family protein [Paraburkholderia sp. NMBU_R16]
MQRRRSSWLPRGVRAMAALACALQIAGAAGAAYEVAPDAGCEPRVAILVYHRFSATADDSMTVRVTTFESQLAFFREHGYRFVPLDNVVRWIENASTTLPDKSVALTVDDGHRSVYEALRPIVLRERLPVTLFIYPSAISNASYALTWDQLRDLQRTGFFDVQSHTYWHPNFNTERRRRSADDFRQFARFQFAHSRQRLEAELGTRVDTLAWPFGIYDDGLMALAGEDRYIAGVTLDPHFVERHARLLALPRFLMIDAYGPAALARLFGDDKTHACPR